MRNFAACVLVAGLVVLPGVGMAQGVAITPEQVVKARQGGMAMVGSIADQMKAGVAAGVDPKQYEDQAAAMAKWGTAYPALYPDGTQNIAETKAKPEIWSDRAGFDKADQVFVTASTALAQAAKSGDKAAFAAAFAEEGKSCGGCHRNYKNR